MKINKVFLSLLTLAGFVPEIACANTDKTLAGLVYLIISYLNLALIFIIVLAVVAFVYFVVKFFILEADKPDRKKAGSYVMYSLIAFFIVLSFWGLVNILQNTFNIGNDRNAPTSWGQITNIFPGSSSSSGNNSSGQTIFQYSSSATDTGYPNSSSATNNSTSQSGIDSLTGEPLNRGQEPAQ